MLHDATDKLSPAESVLWVFHTARVEERGGIADT